MEKPTLTTEELNVFLLKIINNTGGIRRKMVALKKFLQKHKVITNE